MKKKGRDWNFKFSCTKKLIRKVNYETGKSEMKAW